MNFIEYKYYKIIIIGWYNLLVKPSFCFHSFMGSLVFMLFSMTFPNTTHTSIAMGVLMFIFATFAIRASRALACISACDS